LLLHLDGNVRQWILSALEPNPIHVTARANSRRAPAQTPRSYVAALRGTVGEAVDLIRSLPHRRLTEQVSIQGDDTTVLSAIFHVVEHFSGHTYQIILLTKRFTGKDLGFYSYLDNTGRREPTA
jgi:hypothetical protein